MWDDEWQGLGSRDGTAHAVGWRRPTPGISSNEDGQRTNHQSRRSARTQARGADCASGSHAIASGRDGENDLEEWSGSGMKRSKKGHFMKWHGSYLHSIRNI